jgi:hypothetical protein
MLLIGFISGNVGTMIVGAVVTFGYTSIYLTSYVESEYRAKKVLEVILMLSAFGLVVYGYTVTGSFVLGVMTIFIVTMVLVAFVVSYLLPRIRSESKSQEK